MIELTIIGLVNALAFWQRGRNYNFLFIPAAALDFIYGFIFAVSGDIPSTTFYEGITIVAIGLYCFFGEFLPQFWHR
jgi:hypothetical protein